MTMAAFLGGVGAGLVLAFLTRFRPTRTRFSADPTGDALRPLLLRGWKTLANARLGRSGEIDHVAIGPAGVLLIETKYRREAPTQRDLHAALRQVRHNLRELRGAMGRALHGAPVQGVVVVWGPHEGLEPTMLHDGVLVIAGDHLGAWLETLAGSHLDDQEVVDLHEQLVRGVSVVASDEATAPARRISTRAA